MGLFTNFKTSKPKQFSYRPLYYDERKERLEKMKARAAADGRHFGLEKGFLSEKKARRTNLQDASMWRIFRFLAILIVLLGIAYVVAPAMFLSFWNLK